MATPAGLIPTGSEDPYGLRRQSVAILTMLADRGTRLSLKQLIAGACGNYKLKKGDADRVANDTLDFFRQRLAGMLASEGLRPDVIDAALSVAFDDPLIAIEKVRALDALRA